MKIYSRVSFLPFHQSVLMLYKNLVKHQEEVNGPEHIVSPC